MQDTITEFVHDSDIDDFIRRYKEALLELKSKKELLTEKNQELQIIESDKTFLQQELDKLQHEKDYVQKQLDEIKKISRQREEEWSNFRDNWAENKVKFEISSKASDAYKAQIFNQQQEISKLKAEKENFERQIRDNSVWKEKCLLTQNRVESTTEMLIRQIRSLEQDHIRLDSTTKAAIVVANKTEQFRKNYENLLKQHTEENVALKKRVLELSGEGESSKSPTLTTLGVNMKELDLTTKTSNEPVEQYTESELMKAVEEWKECQDGNQNDLQHHIDQITEIYDKISKLQASESDVAMTIKNLEEKLEEKNKKPDVQEFGCQVDMSNEIGSDEKELENLHTCTLKATDDTEENK